MENSFFKILAIDDTADNLLVLKALMSEFFPNSNFFMAQSGDEGLKLCQKEKPDVILLDVIMPQMDGYEVCRILKSKQETQHIPVVMITAARTDTDARIRALENGADAFLSKPVDETELKAQIMAMLRIKFAEDHKADEKNRLEQLIQERTSLLEKELEERKAAEAKLQKAIKELEESQKAALNLMEDLQLEMKEKITAQETLKSSEERFRLVFENSPLGMLSFSEKGLITACNDQFVDIIGSTLDKLIGLDMLLLPDQKLVETLKKALEGEKASYDGLYKSFTAEKETQVRVQFAPIFNDYKKVIAGVGLVEDITEQHQYEIVRKELEERFMRSFYSSPVAISITRVADASIVDINDAYCRLTGFEREQLIGNSILELGLLQPETRVLLLEEIEKNNSIKEFEVLVTTRTKDQLVVLLSVERYEMNNEIHLLSTLLDITERTQFEQELLKLTRAVEQSPVSIVITDLFGTIEYVNPRVVETTGYQPHELIGQNPRVLTSGETTREEYLQMYETIQRGEVWKGEFHNKRKNGELYWEQASISPVINDEGVMTHYIAVKEDVTQQKLLQQELIDNENLYRNIFTGNPIPMWIYDVNSLRFIEVNEAAIKNYGYTHDEFLSLKLMDIRPPEDIPALIENVNQNLDAKQGPGQWRHILKDGSIIDVEVSSHALPSQKGLNHRMVMAYNVTEKKAANEALLKAKALAEASDKLKTEFLNNISHEVRTPLNGIMGATMLLNEPDLRKEDMPELLDIVNLSTDRLIQTVTDYMDISLLTSGNMEKNLEVVKLLKILNKVVDKFRIDCQRKSLEFITDFPVEAPIHQIETDAEMLGKALNHLLSNAVKFTTKGSVTFGYRTEKDHYSFFVKDTGIGIEAPMQNKVFERFSQEDSSSSRKYEGSGLGLSIVKGIAVQLGGSVSLDSAKGLGSTFSITIPFQQKSVKTVEKSVEETEKLVMIAEDEDSNYVVLEMIMRKAFKAQIIRAWNGEEAVQIAKNHPELKLIIMDIKMPVMDGFEATREIKAVYPAIPIIAITAFAMSGDEYKAKEAGCDDYIAKPINRTDLFRKLSEFGFNA